MDQKNEDISESVNSFGPGAIFLPRLGQYLSRNALVGPILFLERISLAREGFFMLPKTDDFHEILKAKKGLGRGRARGLDLVCSVCTGPN